MGLSLSWFLVELNSHFSLQDLSYPREWEHLPNYLLAVWSKLLEIIRNSPLVTAHGGKQATECLQPFLFFSQIYEQLGKDAKRGCRTFAILITPRLRGTPFSSLACCQGICLHLLACRFKLENQHCLSAQEELIFTVLLCFAPWLQSWAKIS